TPWLEAAAITFQAAVQSMGAGQPGSHGAAGGSPPGTCVLFTDALRFDLAQQLAAGLEQRGLDCHVRPYLAALPTVTGTAKPAASPVASLLTGQSATDLTPRIAATGKSVTAEA